MSEDFLTIDTNQAAATEAQSSSSENGKQQDPNVWKPSIGRDVKEYEAKVRLLPQGLNGVKNKLPASVSYKMHYLKDPKNKIYKNVPCRKTLGEDCPVCEAAWSIYNVGKDKNDEALMKLAKSRLPATRHVINILVREDLTKPVNDAKVLKWDHTDHINKTLMDPLRDVEEADGETRSKFKKAKEKFTPYSPRGGRDRFVIVERNPSNDMPTYENSFWDEDGLTDLAATSDEMLAVLDQCHDLSTYRDVPSSEELMKQYNEFVTLVEMKERNSGGVAGASVPTDRPAGGNAAAPAKQNLSNGDAASYFEAASAPTKAEPADMFDMNSGNSTVNSAPVESQPVESEAPISSDAEDELPF